MNHGDTQAARCRRHSPIHPHTPHLPVLQPLVCLPPLLHRVGQPAPGKEPPTFEARLYDVLFKGQNPAALVSGIRFDWVVWNVKPPGL